MKDWDAQEQKQALEAIQVYFTDSNSKTVDIATLNDFHANQPTKLVSMQKFTIQLPPYTFIEDFAIAPCR